MPAPRISALVHFMTQRHHIYLLRQAGKAAPWTQDEILRQYRFCNVYRELDKVTVWIRQHIREPYADHPNLWFMLALARQINWPPTLQCLMQNGAWPEKSWNPQRARKTMLKMQGRGEQVYTAAYMLTCTGQHPKDPKDKPFYTCHRILAPLWQQRHVIEPSLRFSLQRAHQALSQQFGFGPFLAYEVVTDLRWTRYLCNAPDIMIWANAGPGAIRGLNRVFGREVKYRIGEDQAVEEMNQLLHKVNREWPSIDKDWPALELRDIEHSLCELDKYERVRLGEGRPRMRYNGVQE